MVPIGGPYETPACFRELATISQWSVMSPKEFLGPHDNVVCMGPHPCETSLAGPEVWQHMASWSAERHPTTGAAFLRHAQSPRFCGGDISSAVQRAAQRSCSPNYMLEFAELKGLTMQPQRGIRWPGSARLQ